MGYIIAIHVYGQLQNITTYIWLANSRCLNIVHVLIISTNHTHNNLKSVSKTVGKGIH